MLRSAPPRAAPKELRRSGRLAKLHEASEQEVRQEAKLETAVRSRQARDDRKRAAASRDGSFRTYYEPLARLEMDHPRGRAATRVDPGVLPTQASPAAARRWGGLSVPITCKLIKYVFFTYFRKRIIYL